MALQEKEEVKDVKVIGEVIRKKKKNNRSLSNLGLTPFKLLVKGKHSAGKSFQSFATQGKKLLI